MSSSKKVGKSLSDRLRHLSKHYQNQKYIWDIGCDHGLLGMSFYGLPGVEVVNLVDPSKPVIEELKARYKDSYITKAPLNIIHSKGQDLSIDQYSNCIFIAGMGGKEIGEIILNLLPQLDPESRIIISPHRKILELRELLGNLPISLVTEEVIEEEDQFYQILVLRPGIGKSVSPYGHDLWKSEIGEKYRLQQLKTYEIHKDTASIKYLLYLKSMLK